MMNKLKFTLALVLIALFALQSCDKQEIVEDVATTPEQVAVTPSNGSETARVSGSNYIFLNFHWPLNADGEPLSESTKEWTRQYYTSVDRGTIAFSSNTIESWDMSHLRQHYYALPLGTRPPSGDELPTDRTANQVIPITIDEIIPHN